MFVLDRFGYSASKRIHVSLPPGDTAQYAFVDSYTLDGGAPVTCASEPSTVRPVAPGSGSSTRSPDEPVDIAATLLQPLPALPCGKVYTPPMVVKPFVPRTGNYGNKALTASVHVYIDSNGHLAKSLIYKSSGVDGVDDEAMGSAERSTYKPATLLCTPVVGEYLFTFTYGP